MKTLIIEKLLEKQHKKGVLLLQYAMKCEIKKIATATLPENNDKM